MPLSIPFVGVFQIFTIFATLCTYIPGRVSFETSFDSKQPKLEPKLVSALFKTKRLFRLFRFYSETASFGVSVKPKLTETNRNQPKQAENSAFCFSIFSLKLSVLHHLVLSLDVSVLLYCLWIYLYLL